LFVGLFLLTPSEMKFKLKKIEAPNRQARGLQVVSYVCFY